MAERKFANGIYFNPAHEKAPSFVLGKISVQRDNFIKWLNEQEISEKGYVKMDVQRAKTDKIVIYLDDFKGEKTEATEAKTKDDTTEEIQYPVEDINPEDIPF